ncbi:MAG: aminotransferase class I/II-fold pyridoxal phosphate-dependent enzyme [Parcubacteria group bacterium]|nr:aminotransferase class I/II-fold pyridoxal phosphate-dependent enzyme [Parcubacteria group bacterium]
MLRIQPISISLSPNTERDDILLALKQLFQPWRWKKKKEVALLERAFAKRLDVSHAVAFNSGRSSLLAILEALGLKKGDEVLLQAFTCNAVPNPIIWAGLNPVYVDCSREDFNMDAKDLIKKITKRSRAVIVQHTFGMPADMEKIAAVCKEHNLFLIEDCAHALGAKFQGKQVGTFGDAAFFSFSRDKVISCVYGGMAITDDKKIGDSIRKFQEKAGNPSSFWIMQQLLHPLLMNMLILPTYRVFGKYILLLFQQTHVLSKAVHWKEKQGQQPGYFPKALPGALAVLAMQQLRKLEKFNRHRKKLAEFYEAALEGSPFGMPEKFSDRQPMHLRFVLQHPRAHEIIRRSFRQNLLVGDWYTSPIAPDDTQAEKVGYKKGMCPVAERLSRSTLNMPTHINTSLEDAENIVNTLLRHGG